MEQLDNGEKSKKINQDYQKFEKQLKNGNAIGSNAVLGLQEASIDVCSHDICVRLYLNNNGLDEFIGVYHLDKSSRLLKPVKIFYRN